MGRVVYGSESVATVERSRISSHDLIDSKTVMVASSSVFQNKNGTMMIRVTTFYSCVEQEHGYFEYLYYAIIPLPLHCRTNNGPMQACTLALRFTHPRPLMLPNTTHYFSIHAVYKQRIRRCFMI